MKKKILKEQSGRSMIEAIGYISIMIMLTVSITAAVNSGYFKFRLGRIHQELMDLIKVISQRYVAAENYKDVKFNTLVEEKIVPIEIKKGTHSFGGTIEIGKGDENGNTYFIRFNHLPTQSCMELGSRLWIVNDGSDLDAMDINGKIWAWKYSNSVAHHDYELPALVSDVSVACNPTCKDEDDNIIPCPKNNHYIKWYFN